MYKPKKILIVEPQCHTKDVKRTPLRIYALLLKVFIISLKTVKVDILASAMTSSVKCLYAKESLCKIRNCFPEYIVTGR